MYIGIDPGKTGALAVLDEKGKYLNVIDFDTKNVVLWMSENANAVSHGYLEHIHSMPEQGVVSTFNFGENFGWWKGVLDAVGISYTLVRPQMWMHHYGLKKQSPSDKPGLVLARKLLPDAPISLKKHHNRADALLIAFLCWEREGAWKERKTYA